MRSERSLATLPAMVQETISRLDDQPALRFWREGSWRNLTWKEFGRRLKNLGTGLHELGIRPGDRVALFGPNGPEWLLSDVALASLGAVVVPIYTTLHADTITAILKSSGARAIVVIGEAQIEAWRRLQPTLSLADNWLTVVADCREVLTGWHTFENVVTAGESRPDKRQFFQQMEKVERSHLWSIIYTSGTTGDPKGVMLTHDNFMSNVWEIHSAFGLREGEETYLSCLPLSHAFERVVHYTLILAGAQIVYSRSLDQVGEDLVQVEPTIFIGVPRLFEKAYAKIIAAVDAKGWLSQKLFAWARRQPAKHGMAERLVYQKIRRRFGRRLRILACAGNPLSLEISKFFLQIGLPICECYGLTEASPAVSVTLPSDVVPGSVGKPLANLEVRLTAEGELCVRGPSVFSGYYQNRKATEAVLDQDGWLHTGDLASMDAQGRITITGRIKDILKTSGGKMVAPSAIEERFKSFKWCEQICLVGDNRPYFTALVVLNPTVATTLMLAPASDGGAKGAADLVLDEKLWPVIEADVRKVNATLASFESIKRIALMPRLFSEEDATLTPAQKLRRHVIEKTYAPWVDALYQEPGVVVRAKLSGRDVELAAPILAVQ